MCMLVKSLDAVPPGTVFSYFRKTGTLKETQAASDGWPI